MTYQHDTDESVVIAMEEGGRHQSHHDNERRRSRSRQHETHCEESPPFISCEPLSERSLFLSVVLYGHYSVPILTVEQHETHLSVKDNVFSITAIHHDATSQHLHIGDQVISVNGTTCVSPKTLKKAWKTRGPNTIVAENANGFPDRVSVLYCRSHGDETLGITVHRHKHQWILSSVPNDSLLDKGDVVISINKVACHDLDKETVAKLLSQQNATIVTQTDTLLAAPLSSQGAIQAYTHENHAKRCDNAANLGWCLVFSLIVTFVFLFWFLKQNSV